MFCGTCGKKIEDDAAFCRFCGAKVRGFERVSMPAGVAAVPVLRSLAKMADEEKEPAAGPVVKEIAETPTPEYAEKEAPAAAKAPPKLRGAVIASMILGACSLLLGLLELIFVLDTAYPGLVCGVIAVIFGAINLRYKKPNRPFCIAGLSAGAAGIILCVVLMLISGELRLRTPVIPQTTPPTTTIVDGGDYAM